MARPLTLAFTQWPCADLTPMHGCGIGHPTPWQRPPLPRAAARHCAADVEASTDGFTEGWAKGQINSVHEPKMGWGAGGLYIQHFTLNVGCAFFRPTERAIDLLRRVAETLSRASAWDQQVFNSEAFLLSHGDYNGSKVAVRVMDYMKWVNSKVFFFSQRSAFFPGKATPPDKLPVMVHMNCAPPRPSPSAIARSRPIRVPETGAVRACIRFVAGGSCDVPRSQTIQTSISGCCASGVDTLKGSTTLATACNQGADGRPRISGWRTRTMLTPRPAPRPGTAGDCSPAVACATERSRQTQHAVAIVHKRNAN